MQLASADFSATSIIALIACHVAGLIFLPAMPLVMGAFVSDFAANSDWLGRIASMQLMTTACGALCFSVLGSKWNCRTMVLLALCIETGLNLATALADSIFVLLWLRGLSGFAQGILLAAAGAGAALATRTEKTYALYNIVLALFAVVVLISGAGLVKQYGNKGVFGLIVCVDILAFLVMLQYFPSFQFKQKATQLSIERKKVQPGALQVLFALGLFGIALSGTKTFMERLSFFHGTNLEVMAFALALGWSTAVVSPFFLVIFCDTYQRVRRMLILAYMGVALLAFLLAFAPIPSIFLIAMGLFTPVVMFIEPLQFGVLGRLDSSGRLAALGPAAISVGCGIGPLLASEVVSRFSLVGVGILACGLFLISFILLYPFSRSPLSESNANAVIFNGTDK